MNNSPSRNTFLLGYNQTFLDLINHFENEKFPNKILLSGKKGIGKSTFAYHLINYIFSKNEENKYNLKNNLISENNKSYNLVINNSHPNFFLVSSDDDKKNIQVSKIREMINFTNKSSFNNNYKIILIDNVEYLNNNSINALLKVVEEPNNKIIFILVHDNSKKILGTLNSRCIKFNFFLNNDNSLNIVNKLSNFDFYNNLNNDFKNIYLSPGEIISLYKFFKDNNINEEISVDDFLKLVIEKRFYKKDLFVKEKLPFFVELFFKKKLNYYKSKDKIYNMYKYFLLKFHDCTTYNLDIENVLIELNQKLLNE